MKTSRTAHRLAAGFGAFTAALTIAGAAEAQNALGGGNALDANLSQQSPINQRQGGVDSELRFRNSIVTGNAPGGFSFRGNVGYTAPNDFRDNTGSDDLYNFARDSFFSGLAAQGFQGTDALRFQTGLTTFPTLNRPSAGASGSDLALDSGRVGLPDFNPLNIDSGALRSTSEFLSDLSLTPSLVGTRRLGESEEGAGLQYTVASPLLGVTKQDQPGFSRPASAGFRPAERTSQLLEDLRSEDRITDRPDSDSQQPRRALDDLRRTLQERRSGLEGGEDQEEGPSLPSARSPQRPGDRTEPGGGEQPGRSGQQDLQQRLREDLQRDAQAEQDSAPRALTIEERIEQLRQTLRASPKDLAGDNDEEEEVESTIDLLRQSRLRIDQFSPPASEERDLFAEHMNRAEELLAQGLWFDAEERFTSALTMRPDSEMAAAGRIHAQIGGGLFLSASVNLKQLLRQHPELIPVQYDAELLPKPERMDSLTRQLRARAGQETEMARRAALLLAYLGHQRGDQEMVKEGFEAIDRLNEALDGGGDARFYDLLRKVWMK